MVLFSYKEHAQGASFTTICLPTQFEGICDPQPCMLILVCIRSVVNRPKREGDIL